MTGCRARRASPAERHPKAGILLPSTGKCGKWVGRMSAEDAAPHRHDGGRRAPGSGRGAAGLGRGSPWELAHAAAETRRLDLGVGVIPLHTRGPASIVDGVRQHALAPERLLLGVGSPNPEALKRVRDGVAALRAKLSTRIIVAALGPKMCHLAGEVADGVLFNWLTPEYARRSADLVRAGAAAAKRPMPRLYANVRVALGPAAERMAEEGARYDAIPAYHAHFVRIRREDGMARHASHQHEVDDQPGREAHVERQHRRRRGGAATVVAAA
jgi:alkanesulfonate monooxygenase SsuD/methylene tetrahydromethanopterin reductase-like flavin-dependent oxidoreductase (luciferase family)